MSLKRKSCLKNKLTFVIKGQEWTFEILTEKGYARRHKDMLDSHAMTIFAEKRVDFNGEISLGVVAHELYHIEAQAFCLESTREITPGDYEEITCCFMQYNLFRYHDMAYKIFEDFVGPEVAKAAREELCK